MIVVATHKCAIGSWDRQTHIFNLPARIEFQASKGAILNATKLEVYCLAIGGLDNLSSESSKSRTKTCIWRHLELS